eukprot:jgi/Mesvir1/1091/Mv25694-RA.1
MRAAAVPNMQGTGYCRGRFESMQKNDWPNVLGALQEWCVVAGGFPCCLYAGKAWRNACWFWWSPLALAQAMDTRHPRVRTVAMPLGCCLDVHNFFQSMRAICHPSILITLPGIAQGG